VNQSSVNLELKAIAATSVESLAPLKQIMCEIWQELSWPGAEVDSAERSERDWSEDKLVIAETISLIKRIERCVELVQTQSGKWLNSTFRI
jgi:hypothetical protein